MESKRVQLAVLAELVQGELVGGPETEIVGVNDLARAGPEEISFLSKASREEELQHTRAAAVVVPPGVGDGVSRPLIRVADPSLAITRIHSFFLAKPFEATGLHPSVVVGRDCRIPDQVRIGAGVVLGDGVCLGQKVTIHPGVVLGDGVEIGDESVIHSNVSIGWGCRLGKRVIIHSGAVIGSDGFGYATDGDGRHHKRPHVGIVRIDDDVEIGANVCIDRATFGETRVGRGTKIDNLVQLGHNVEIGEDVLLVAQVGIAGSTRVGDQVVMGGQVGVGGHLRIGRRVMVAAKSGVHNDQPEGAVVAGIPAIPHRLWLRACAVFARLPELARELRHLRRLAGTGKDEEGASGEVGRSRKR